jgi:tetratricopeptide (TPR) repeat protein
MEGNVVKKAVTLSAASAASAPPNKKRAFRSVLDYETEEELRHALNYCNVSSVLGASAVAGAVASTVAAAPVAAAAAEARCGVKNVNSNNNSNNNNKATDWLLSVPDGEAEAQDVETEVQRLLNLRSYRALDDDDDDDQNFEHGRKNNDSDALLSTVFSETQRAHEREKFDALCREACLAYQVPVSTVSLVDLGRQYAFSSHGLPPNMPRSVSRQVAFCAHAILKKHKTGITVVKDTLQDARFQNNILVTQAPHLRFYAGAPLQSPEGYNLGTFCVEGPEPKPEGLSRDQQANLRDYAKRVVDLLVLRRRTLLERLVSATKHASSMCTDGSESSLLLRHAGVTTNLGGLLHYYQYSSNNNAQVHNSSSDENDDNNISFAASGGGSCVTAMHLFQESVQTLMLLQENDSSAAAADAKNDTTTFTAAVATPSSSVSPASDNKPSKGRLQEMLQLWTLLSAANNAKPSRKTFFQTFRRLFPPMSMTHTTTTGTTTTANTASSSTSITTSSSTIPESTATAASTIQLCPHHASIVGGIPGLFSRSSKLKGSMPAMAMTKPATQNAKNRQSSPSSTSSVLVFSEPFRISIGSERDQGIEPYFLVPLEQCAKATLFNMGLIHYHWGNVETAMQFYDLASSLSQQLSPLAFDPVILGSFNNKAQILLQHYGRQSDAMEILQDALTRGNAALVTLYEREGITDDAATDTADADPARVGGWCARRLRRKLARTVMNLGHVHFVRCEYDAAMATCNDALRLLHANMEDMEVCAVWHNMGLIHYYNSNNQQGNSAANNKHDSYNSKTLALEYLNRFLDRAPAFIGSEHLQIAEALHIVGLIYFEGMGNLYQKSIQPLNEALRIRQSRLGANHALVAESLCVIGRLLQAREEYDFAIGALTNGIAILRGQGATENASNCNHTNNTSAEKLTSVTLSFDGARALLELGRAFHAQGCLMDALSVYIEATEWSKHTFGHHVYVARLLNLVGNLHLETGHVDMAMECFSQAAYIFLQQEIPMVWNLVQDPLLHVQLVHHPVAPTA